MKIRASFYLLLTLGALLSSQLFGTVNNPVFSETTRNASRDFTNVFEMLKQHGTVDFVANAKARFAGVSANPKFQERISKVKEKLATSRKTRTSFQPGIDCKIPVVLIPQDTVFIDKPGYYILDCQNLNYDANPLGFIPAIQIVSEDVTLDLNGLTIQQADPTIPYGYAIQIGYGYFPQTIEEQNFVAKNVTIKNGTIKQFTGNGVLAFNNTFGTLFGDPATTEQPFEDIELRNLNVLECGIVTRDINATDPLGIIGISLFAFNRNPDFGAAPTYGFKNIVVDTVHVNDSSAPAVTAFLINKVENVILNNTTANNTIGTDFDDPGFAIAYNVSAFYIEGKNIQLFKCQGNGTQDLHTGVDSLSAQVGSFFQRSLDVYMSECQFNDTYGENNRIINVNPSNTVGWLAENCQFNNNRGGLRAVLIVGVHLSDSIGQVINANGMKWVNCQFNNHSVNPDNQELGTLVGGYIAITANDIEFVECQSCNIRGESPTAGGFGIINTVIATDPLFPFANVTSTVFKMCTISNIVSNGSCFGLGSSYRSGARTRQAHNSNLVVEDCIVENLRSFSTNSTLPIAGIALANLTPLALPETNVLPSIRNVLIKNSRVSDVLHQPGGNSKGTPNRKSAAILIESAKNPTLLNNSVADCDRGILFTGIEGIVPNAFQLATTEENAFAQPPIPINIGTPSNLTVSPVFLNETRGNQAIFENINATRDLLYPEEDLTTLGWQLGDIIQYSANGATIPGLVNGATYFLIVYTPGFSEHGLVQDNKIQRNRISGIEDAKSPCTSSLFITNNAFCNGLTHRDNYTINWGSPKNVPVAKGTLINNAKPKFWSTNISTICDRCECVETGKTDTKKRQRATK